MTLRTKTRVLLSLASEQASWNASRELSEKSAATRMVRKEFMVLVLLISSS
jgi:hypothetical protein